jgi:hypothetical protein
MSSFTVEVQNRQVVQALRKGNRALIKGVDFAVQRAATDTGRKMMELAPKAFSALVTSITPEKIGLLAWRVGPHVNYAEHVEKGSGPGGFVPIRSLLSWIREKGITPNNPDFTSRDLAWAVRRKIAQSGIKAQPFVKPVYDSGFPQRRLQQLVDKAARKTLKKAGL